MMELLVILGIAGALIIWAILLYNNLVRDKNMVEEGWSGIDVQLKRRSNLIPNLIETVKGYMDHESEVLEEVTKLRVQSLNAGAPGERGQSESLLSRALGNLFAVAENYPDLKASSQFQDLQKSLEEIEDQIQMARRYYNGTVRNLNINVESFPSSLIANRFGFIQAEFFEIDDPAERALPIVEF